MIKKCTLALVGGIFFVSPLAHAQLAISKTTPSPHGSLKPTQSIGIDFNAPVNDKTVLDSTVRVHGNFSGNANSLSRGTVSKPSNTSLQFAVNPKSFSYHANERVQVSVTNKTLDANGKPLVSPKTVQYRVAATAGTGQFGRTETLYSTFRGQGSSMFQLADMDNNGELDVVTYSSNGSLTIHARKGEYYDDNQSTTLESGGMFLHVADFKGDGYPDILLFNPSSEGVLLYPNEGGKISTDYQNIFMQSMPLVDASDSYVPLSGDIDADGDLDFVFACGYTGQYYVTIARNNGSGFNTEDIDLKANDPGSNLSLWDVDNDGDLDIVSNSGTYAANVNGKFSTIALKPAVVLGVEEVDFNNDGRLDLVQLVKRKGGASVVLTPNAGGTWGTPKSISIALDKDSADGITSGDFNGDGWIDFAFTSKVSKTYGYILSDKAGGFQKPVIKYLEDEYEQLAAGDLDNDGDVDLIGLNQTFEYKMFNIFYNEPPCKPLVVTRINAQSNDSGLYPCGSLPYAISYANDSSVGVADTIRFQLTNPASKYTLFLTRSLEIKEPLVVLGPGKDHLAIDGSYMSSSDFGLFYTPVFRVERMERLEAEGDTTVFQGLTLQNMFNSNGGAGISHTSGQPLLLKDCDFLNNRTTASGAGLYYYGRGLQIDNCRFEGNQLQLDDSNNFGNGAGAFINLVDYAGKATMTINNSTFANNATSYTTDKAMLGDGGGLYLYGGGFGAKIVNTSFYHNTSERGGALHYQSISRQLGQTLKDSLTISSSTFSANTASKTGGAVHVTALGKLFIQNSTLAQNGADSLLVYINGIPSFLYPTGGALCMEAANVIARNTIFAGNRAYSSKDIRNVRGVFNSQGGNLIGVANDNGTKLALNKTLDVYDSTGKIIDPRLLPLDNYGGPTLTHHPQSTSPVLNKGINGQNPTKDQRGQNRIFGTTVDIGAVEAQSVCANPLVVTSRLDTAVCGTLRYAILTANVQAGNDVITFAPGSFNASGDSIVLSKRIEITDGITIKGLNNLAISTKNPTENLFHIATDQDISFSQLIFRSSKDTVYPAVYHANWGGKHTYKRCTFANNMSKGSDAAGLSTSALTISIDSCRFVGNKCIASTINSNRSVQGGGLHVFLNSDFPSGIVHVSNTEFYANQASHSYAASGGGAHFTLQNGSQKLILENTAFYNNTALTGGGFYVSGDNAKTTIVNSTISGNKGDFAGGGAYLQGDTITIINSSIINNRQDVYTSFGSVGGGLYVPSSTVLLKNTVLAGNKAIKGQNDLYLETSSKPLRSLGNNFISDSLVNSYRFAKYAIWTTSDILGDTAKPIDTKLAPLAYNGGYTQNHVPLLGSPLINKGGASADMPARDQRGLARDTKPDIGSVEYNGFANFPTVFAGNDTAVCDTVFRLRTIPVTNPYKGTWGMISTASKVLVRIPDSTKAKLPNKLTLFVWTVTDGTFTKYDTIAVTSNYIRSKPFAGANKTVLVDTTLLTGTFVTGYTNRWRKLTGTGTFKDSTSANTSVRKLSEGINALEYRYWLVANCPRRDTIEVTYEVLRDTAKAGDDQYVCADTVRLVGNTPNKGFKGKWSVKSGVAAFANKNDSIPNAKITFQKGANVTLLWTLTNQYDKKSVLDSVTIHSVPVTVQITEPGKTDTVYAFKRDFFINADIKSVGSTASHTWFVNGISGDNVPLRSAAKLVNDTMQFRILADNGDCQASDSVAVVFRDSTNAYAGIDQSLCQDSTALEALKPVKGATGKWTILKSNARFAKATDDTLYNAKLVRIPVGETKLVWTVTNQKIITRDTVSIVNNLKAFKANAGTDIKITTDTTTLLGNTELNTSNVWRNVNEGTGVFADSTKNRTVVSNLKIGNNQFVYVLLGACERTDTVSVFLTAPRISAGVDDTVCTDTAKLAALKAPLGFTAAWRSKQSSLQWNDSTLPTANVYPLTLGKNELVWVLKKQGNVVGRDTVVITKAPAPETKIPKYLHACIKDTTLIVKIALGETLSWSSNGQAKLSSTTVSGTYLINNLERNPKVNKFDWRLSKGSCTVTGTLPVYRADTIITVVDSDSVIAGETKEIKVYKNDLYAQGDVFKHLLTVKPLTTDTSAITTITTKGDSIVVFKTNRKLTAQVTYRYSLSNQCGAKSNLAQLIIKTLNAAPVPLELKGEIAAGKIFTLPIPISTLDKNGYLKRVVVPQLSSGAKASYAFDSDTTVLTLTVDYTQVTGFKGNELARFEICDGPTSSDCATLSVLMDVTGGIPLTIYNALSPNGDGIHDVLEMEGIEQYPNNKLQIFNRWGDNVYQASGYNGTTKAFDGGSLPDGTYYYVLDLGNGEKLIEGYIVLKR